MIHELLLFTGGIIIGGAIGSLVTYKIVKKKCDEEINEEIAAFSKYRYEDKSENTEKSSLDDAEVASKASEAVKKKAEKAKEKNQAVNYNAFSENGVQTPPDMITKPHKTIEEPEEIWPEEEETQNNEPEEWEAHQNELYIQGLRDSERHDMRRHDAPKIIKAENYGEDGTLTRSTLLYYQDDDTLVEEETGTEIFDQNLTVGNALDKYGFRKNTEKTIYVRNYVLGFDYCVKKVFDSFVPIGNETG